MSQPTSNDAIPGKAGDIQRDFPELWAAYAALGAACAQAGPIDQKTLRLIKLALAIGAGSEGAVHSHTRRAIEEGHDPQALRQVALLAIPTLGFPQAIAGLSWIDDLVGR